MHRAAICGPRGQVAASAAAGAPASAFTAPTRSATASPPRPAPSFFCASRAPARLISNSWPGGAAWLVRRPIVTVVTQTVTAPVTAKPLFLHGLRGSYRSYRLNGALDVCTGARASAPISLSSNGNIGNNVYYCLVSEACALLSLLPAATLAVTPVTAPGARPLPFLLPEYNRGRIFARRSPEADLHLLRAGWREKFRGSVAWAGSRAQLGLAGELGSAGSGARGGNGGFPPFFGWSPGAVGTLPLERSEQAPEIIRFSVAARKLPQLASVDLAGQLAADRGRPGVPPPAARAAPRIMLARTFVRIWIEDAAQAPPGSPDRAQAGSERALNSIWQNGLGVSASRRARKSRSGGPRRSKIGVRVGDGRSSVGRPDEASRLCRGGDHVNA